MAVQRKVNRKIAGWLRRGLLCLLTAALLSGVGIAARGADEPIPKPAADAPIVEIVGNAVVNEAKKPTGFYELAVRVQTKVYTYTGSASSYRHTITPEEYFAIPDTDPEKANYRLSDLPFQSVAVALVINTDVLTPVAWDVDEVTYAEWDGSAYPADMDDGYTPTGTSPTGFGRGITNVKVGEATGDLAAAMSGLKPAIPNIVGAELGDLGTAVGLYTAKPDEIGTAIGMAEGYDKATGKTVISMMANIAGNTLGRKYDTATEVIVLRFSYDLKRFPNVKDLSGVTGSFAVQSSSTPPGGAEVVTMLPTDGEAATTLANQTVWYEANNDPSGQTQETTIFYHYLGSEGASLQTNGTEKLTINTVEHELDLPNTEGGYVLTCDGTCAHDGTPPRCAYSNLRNLIRERDGSLRFAYTNDLTYRKATGTGGAQILFYDWDDSLIGTLVVDPAGDVRGAVNEYIEENLVHPDLRAGTVAQGLGSSLPDFTTVTTAPSDPATDANDVKYMGICDSLTRQYTYRGKYPYTVGGSTLVDSTDPDLLPPEEYPLTNKLDYAFYRHVNTVTTVDGVDYYTLQDVSQVPEAAEFPWCYGWAVVEDTSQMNQDHWQVRRDAAKLEDTWTTIGVGELSNVKPNAAATDATTVTGWPADTAATTYPGYIDTSAITTPPTEYTYKTSSADGSSYLHFADFSAMDKLLHDGKNTVIVKAVYEPGEELKAGFNYRIVQSASYNKLNEREAANGGAFSVTVILNRSTYEYGDGELRGVSRVRDPAVRMDTTYDQKWIENTAKGIDHDLDNATEDVAIDLAETMFTKVEIINGDDVKVTLSLTARQNIVNYFLTEMYGENFVSGGTRSANTLLATDGSRLLNNYNYYSDEDSDTTDDYLDITNYEDRDGSRGFVLEGTLNYLLRQATLFNRGQIDNGGFNKNTSDLVFRDANLRMDLSGTQPEASLAFLTIQQRLKDAAAWCEANKSADTWDYVNDQAQLSYHQLQWYLIDPSSGVLGRAAADARTLPFCHLHVSCANTVSGKPQSWSELIAAAGSATQSDVDKIDRLLPGEVESLTHLRADSAGNGFASVAAFKTAIEAAVKAGNTTWDEIQAYILGESSAGADERYWWYDGATDNPEPLTLQEFVDALDDYFTPVTLPDGTTSPRLAKFADNMKVVQAANAAASGDTVDPKWKDATENIVSTRTVDVANDTESTSKFPSAAAAQAAFVKAVTAGRGAGASPADADYWYKLQYMILHDNDATPPTWPTSPTTAQQTEMDGYWWHNGGRYLSVVDLVSMLDVAKLVNAGDAAAISAWNRFTLDKLYSTTNTVFQFRSNFHGDKFTDGTGGTADTFTTVFKQAVRDFVARDGVTKNLTTTSSASTITEAWKQIQYLIIHPTEETGLAYAAQFYGNWNAESDYYWWKDNGTGTAYPLGTGATNGDVAKLMEALFREQANGNVNALNDLTDAAATTLHLIPTYAKTPATEGTWNDLVKYDDVTGTWTAAMLKAKLRDMWDDGSLDSTNYTGVIWRQIQHYILKTAWLDSTSSSLPSDRDDDADGYWWRFGDNNPGASSGPTPSRLDEFMVALNTRLTQPTSGNTNAYDTPLKTLVNNSYGTANPTLSLGFLAATVNATTGAFTTPVYEYDSATAAMKTQAQTRVVNLCKNIVNKQGGTNAYDFVDWYVLQYYCCNNVLATTATLVSKADAKTWVLTKLLPNAPSGWSIPAFADAPPCPVTASTVQGDQGPSVAPDDRDRAQILLSREQKELLVAEARLTMQDFPDVLGTYIALAEQAADPALTDEARLNAILTMGRVEAAAKLLAEAKGMQKNIEGSRGSAGPAGPGSPAGNDFDRLVVLRSKAGGELTVSMY